MADLFQGIWLIVVFSLLVKGLKLRSGWGSKRKKTYQEVKNTQSEHLKCDTHVTVIVKPVEHFDA